MPSTSAGHSSHVTRGRRIGEGQVTRRSRCAKSLSCYVSSWPIRPFRHRSRERALVASPAGDVRPYLCQISICSEISKASSTSIPPYLPCFKSCASQKQLDGPQTLRPLVVNRRVSSAALKACHRRTGPARCSSEPAMPGPLRRLGRKRSGPADGTAAEQCYCCRQMAARRTRIAYKRPFYQKSQENGFACLETKLCRARRFGRLATAIERPRQASSKLDFERSASRCAAYSRSAPSMCRAMTS